MNIPKYIQDMMSRSKFVLGSGDPGYTIQISKPTYYTQISTFRKEIERLIKWANKVPHCEDCPIAVLNRIDKKTSHKYMQYATVTIYDPVMKYLEQYIKED